MARIRSVHPGLFTDAAFVSCSPYARLLVIGIWTEADDQGVFEWKPLEIKMRLLPGDMTEVPPLLAELEAAGLVMRYEVGSKSYGAVRNFRKFQRPKKPNAVHPITDKVRTFIALDDPGSEADVLEDARVPHQFPTSGEIPPQMEDGGGRKKEADASVAKAATKPDEYPPAFDAPWRAYPHVRGRSSKPKALTAWRRLSASDRDALPAAVARYAKEGREPHQDCGAPAMERWLAARRFEDWLPGSDPPRIELTPEVLARRQRHLQDTGEWREAWGDRPA